MKIAILYICTGKYDVFWKTFYKSSEKYFLRDHEKHYFVFTDSKLIKPQNQRIHQIYQENIGWPYNTLHRFQFFLKAEKYLEKFDYIYFFNANMCFQKEIEEEVFPTENESGLLAVLHPGYFDKIPRDFPYERNDNSLAYIKEGSGKHYFMGGFNGGIAKNYLDMVKTLDENIKNDLNRNIIAIWHDESHLNAYLLDKKNKILSPSYGYPEGLKIPFEPKIIILDKNKWGGHNFLRNDSNNRLSIKTKILNWFRRY